MAVSARGIGSGVTLALDAAAGPGTIAVLRDGALLAAADVVMRSEREERFFPAVLATLANAGVDLPALDQIVVGEGPGSFTALRVVAALAKGLAQGRGLPLYAVPSLALMAAPERAGTRWLATLDALRDERYVALVEQDAAGQVRRVEQLGLLRIAAIDARATEFRATAVGPDERHRASPHARAAVHCLALAQAVGPVDLAAWEPRYGRLAEAQVKWEAAQGRPLR